MLTVYLAGPEVFLPDGQEVLEIKRGILEMCGLASVALPAEMRPPSEMPTDELGQEISRRNEQLIAAADVCIANVTPFRGVSADIGTVYELGLAAGLGKWLAAYSNDLRSYRERVEETYGGLQRDSAGTVRDSRHLMVEDHGMGDNLMLDGGLLLRDSKIWLPEEAVVDPLRGQEAFTRAVADVADRTSGKS